MQNLGIVRDFSANHYVNRAVTYLWLLCDRYDTYKYSEDLFMMITEGTNYTLNRK